MRCDTQVLPSRWDLPHYITAAPSEHTTAWCSFDKRKWTLHVSESHVTCEITRILYSVVAYVYVGYLIKYWLRINDFYYGEILAHSYE